MLRKVGPLTVLVPGVAGSPAQPARSWCVPTAANPGDGSPNPQPPPNGGGPSGGGCSGSILVFAPPCVYGSTLVLTGNPQQPISPGQLNCTPYIIPCPP